ncbi:metallophosphoesterase family protein [Paenibacillus lentus]|uniref:DNA repair exonuclease n=1 Tax=Paenibacillus lentus TaxID=1338368 RepID=A0A3S8RYH8_9BACL|nr:DNA repair exonuclease [Paenibacillus lentus]AZK47986.1 DNA repair exonuclease [Paenibacillus lentus]
MIPFRFIHAADLHLDSPFAGMSGVPGKLRQHLQESTFAALHYMVELAIAEQVDFIVVSGDVYDASDSSLRAQLRLREAWDLLGIHGISVYVIHGNHDPLNVGRLRLAHPEHVTVFGSTVESVIAQRRSDGQPVAVISGISYPTSAVTENTSLQFHRDPSSELYHIGLLHANVDGQEGHDAYSPCSLRDLQQSGYDYWALGHIHKRQVLHEAPWVVYPGNIQGRSLKETGAKGCYVVDVDQHGQAELSFRALDHVRWLEAELSITGLSSEEQLRDQANEKLDELREQSDGRLQIVRFVLTGRGALHTLLQTGTEGEELIQELRRRESQRLEGEEIGLDRLSASKVVWPAGLKIRTGPEIDRTALLQEDSFLGELLRLADSVEHEEALLEELVGTALSSVHDHRRLRQLVWELGSEEKAALVRQAAEMAVSLLTEQEAKGGARR